MLTVNKCTISLFSQYFQIACLNEHKLQFDFVGDSAVAEVSPVPHAREGEWRRSERFADEARQLWRVGGSW